MRLNEMRIKCDVVPEKEAKERCLEHRWMKMLDRHCRGAKQRGEDEHDYIADAERRIAAHIRGVPRREPALGAMYNGHFPRYKLVCEWA